MRRLSLQTRLCLLVFLGVVAIWLIIWSQTYRASLHEVDELFDTRLNDVARALVMLDPKGLRAASAQFGDQHTVADIDSDGDDDSGKALAFQAWERDGALLLRTSDAPAIGFSGDSGFLSQSIDGEDRRSFCLWNAGHELRVCVYEQSKVRSELADVVMHRMRRPLYWGLPLLALIIWVIAWRELRSLRQISREIALRDSANLAPVEVQQVPPEVAPLLQALNGLLDRLSHSIERERRFTADAAHELRTPLAAVRAQAELLLSEDDASERTSVARHIIQATDRATHLMQQLLTLARLDEEAPIARHPLDLKKVAENCLAECANEAVKKRIDLSLEADADCAILGDNATLEILLANLVQNAIRYTPNAGRVAVTVDKEQAHIVLSVRDNGPGVSEEHRGRLFERFYRVLGSGVTGSGLGLSIVQRIAEMYGATIRIVEGLDGRGFGVAVAFPPSSAPPLKATDALADRRATDIAALRPAASKN